MCNLSQGILEQGMRQGQVERNKEIIMNMLLGVRGEYRENYCRKQLVEMWIRNE